MNWKQFLKDWLHTLTDESLKGRLLSSKISAVNNWAYYTGITEYGTVDEKRWMRQQMDCCVGVVTFAELN